MLCCAAEEQGKERRKSRGEVVEEGTSLLSFTPKFLQFFSPPPITSDLSNYFLSHLKSSLEPVYTLTLPINTSFQILIIILDCNCQIKSQFLLHFFGLKLFFFQIFHIMSHQDHVRGHAGPRKDPLKLGRRIHMVEFCWRFSSCFFSGCRQTWREKEKKNSPFFKMCLEIKENVQM